MSTATASAQQSLTAYFKRVLDAQKIDINEVQRLFQQERQDRDQRIRVELAKESAVLGSVYEAYHKSVINRVGQIQLLPPGSSFLLNTASAITSTGLTLSSQNISPNHNTVQFDAKPTSSVMQSVTFSYDWMNPRDVVVVVNVIGFLSFNGTIQESAGGDFWPPFTDHYARAYVTGNLGILNLSIPDSTEIPFDQEAVLSLSADAPAALFNLGAVNYMALFRGLALQGQTIVVPVGQTIRIDVTANFASTINDGDIEYNFKDGGKQLESAAAVVLIAS